MAQNAAMRTGANRVSPAAVILVGIGLGVLLALLVVPATRLGWRWPGSPVLVIQGR